MEYFRKNVLLSIKHVIWEDRLLIYVFFIISQEQIKQEHSKKGPALTFTYIAGLGNTRGRGSTVRGSIPETWAYVIQHTDFGKV